MENIKKFESFNSTNKILALYNHLIDFYYDGISVKITDVNDRLRTLFPDLKKTLNLENFLLVKITFQGDNESSNEYSRKNKEFLDLFLRALKVSRGKWPEFFTNCSYIKDIENTLSLKLNENALSVSVDGAKQAWFIFEPINQKK